MLNDFHCVGTEYLDSHVSHSTCTTTRRVFKRRARRLLRKVERCLVNQLEIEARISTGDHHKRYCTSNDKISSPVTIGRLFGKIVSPPCLIAVALSLVGLTRDLFTVCA